MTATPATTSTAKWGSSRVFSPSRLCPRAGHTLSYSHLIVHRASGEQDAGSQNVVAQHQSIVSCVE
eukprot:5787335-Prymnesium_polylepis.1